MKKLHLYTDRGEIFKYSLMIEGAQQSGIKTRLCLEFDNGNNVYFKGRIDENGRCEVNIPALRHLEKGTGIAKVEVVADDTLFEIFEIEFELKQKVVVKLVESSVGTADDVMTSEPRKERAPLEIKENRPKISFSLESDLNEEEEQEEIIVERPKAAPAKKEPVPAVEEEAEKHDEDDITNESEDLSPTSQKFRTFMEYKRRN